MRAERVFQADLRGPFGHDAQRKAGRIYFIDRRRPDQIDRGPSERGEVGLQAARIAGKILMRRKLRGIDEDRDDDAPRSPPRELHQ